eukprot:3185937-Rhodomonas_salina.2
MSEGIFKLLSDPVLQALLLELPVPARWLRASEQRGFGLVRQLQQPPSGRPRVMRALGPATHNLMRGAGSLLQTRVTRLRALQERILPWPRVRPGESLADHKGSFGSRQLLADDLSPLPLALELIGGFDLGLLVRCTLLVLKCDGADSCARLCTPHALHCQTLFSNGTDSRL